jgi:hypothetical protein
VVFAGFSAEGVPPGAPPSPRWCAGGADTRRVTFKRELV